MLKSTRNHWEQYWAGNNLLFTNKIVEELSPFLTDKKSILEIGAGSGTTSIKLAEYNTSVACLDYSKNSAQLIKSNMCKSDTKLQIVIGDAFNIPFRSESFDICFHQGFLEHFTNPEQLLKEQYRILKKDGVILIDVPQKYSLYTIKKHILMRINKWFAGWETEFSASQLNKLLNENGFSPLKTYGRFHIRNLDRIQMRYLKKRMLPMFIEDFYHNTIVKIENSIIGNNIGFSVGIIARKV